MRSALKPSLWWLIVPVLALVTATLDRPRSTHAVHQAEWLRAGDAELRTVRAGVGEPTLVLIHGFGESLLTWQAILDRLAERHRVIAFDLPGFGGSSKPDASYDLPTMVARLSDFLDRWTSGPVVVVGHSMGGELAAALAIERADRIKRVVLIAPAGWEVGLGGIADTMYPEKARAISWYLSSRAFILPEHDLDWLGEPDSAATYTLVGDPEYRRAATRVLEQFDFRGLRESFGTIRQPTLLLWGTLDPVIPFALADSIHGAIPCSGLVTFPNALHRPQVEIPDAVADALERYLRAPVECPEPADRLTR